MYILAFALGFANVNVDFTHPKVLNNTLKYTYKMLYRTSIPSFYTLMYTKLHDDLLCI